MYGSAHSLSNSNWQSLQKQKKRAANDKHTGHEKQRENKGKEKEKDEGKMELCGVVVLVPKSSISGRKSHVQFVSLYILMVFHKDIYIEMDQS